MSNLSLLGELLRSGRSRKPMSLRDVEREIRISNAYLSQLEGGKIKQPSPVTLHKLCVLYGLDYSAVMKLAGYPVPEVGAAARGQRFASRVGNTTPDEEEALVEYLQFLRSRRKK
jgi:HTH-type transcriptional regulator, competence development regulator